MPTHLITAALPDEISELLRYGIISSDSIEKGEETNYYHFVTSEEIEAHLVLTGVGGKNAESVVGKAIADFKPSSITSIGFTGLTRADIEAGVLLIADEVTSISKAPTTWCTKNLSEPIICDELLKKSALSLAKDAGLPTQTGRLLTLPILARTTPLKKWLGKTLDATGVDMESYTIGRLTRDAGIPFITVRAAVDVIDLELPEVVSEIAESKHRLKTIALYLMKNPQDLGRFVTLGVSRLKAQRALALFIKHYMEFLSNSSVLIKQAVG